jgi:hypothetical protein
MSIKFISDSDLECVVGGDTIVPPPVNSVVSAAPGVPTLYNDYIAANGVPPTKFGQTNPSSGAQYILMNGTIAPGITTAAGNHA